MGDSRKVELASLILSGKIEMWFQNWRKEREVIEWEEFEKAIYDRFGDNLMVDIVETFNSLRQEGSVEEFQIKLKN